MEKLWTGRLYPESSNLVFHMSCRGRNASDAFDRMVQQIRLSTKEDPRMEVVEAHVREVKAA